MEGLATILISLAAIFIIWQDFTQREISWLLLPVLLIGILINGLQKLNMVEYLYYIMINGLILLVLIGVLLLYYWVKEKSINNFVGKTIGLGDLLVFVTLCFGFSPINFVVFFLIGLFLTEYDKAYRMTDANYGLWSIGWGGNNRYSVNNISFDENGNILTLERNGQVEEDGTNPFGLIDDLTYT